ncbi:MAG: ferritin-like domain-containing protein [Cyanobacteria bacterium]|nr:ferritin-like domain-containing protein [Cyanobacteriota bacterium]
MSTEFSHEFNSFLAGEISAVEIYELALKRDFGATMIECLSECRKSHADRVLKLTQCVADAGGTPTESSGIWGGFDKLVQNSNSTEHDALAQLEMFEAERLVQYEAATKIVPPAVLQVLTEDLLPAQHETHLKVSTALKALTPEELKNS